MLIAAVAAAIFLASLMAASAASALVTVRHRRVGPIVEFGGTFEIDVTLENDGLTPLTGVFVSASWGTSVLQLQRASASGPFGIFFGPSGFLQRVASPGVFPGDPAGTIRTIQYGAGPGQSAGGGDEVSIATLIFLVVGAGSADVSIVLNNGDGVLGAGGVSLPSPSVCFIGFSAFVGDGDPGREVRGAGCPPIPEPGTGLLLGLGLAILGASRRP
jgi:hypothetical protein